MLPLYVLCAEESLRQLQLRVRSALGAAPNRFRSGYVRETSNRRSRCVPITSCPEHLCNATDPNSEYSTCGPKTEASCQPSSHVWGSGCVKGCVCKPGFVLWDKKSGKCVKKEECPRDKSRDTRFGDCGRNEDRVACRDDCQPHCDDVYRT